MAYQKEKIVELDESLHQITLEVMEGVSESWFCFLQDNFHIDFDWRAGEFG
jgi:hypothetical protein